MGWAFVLCKCQFDEKKKKPLRWISTIALSLRVHAGKFLRALIKVEAMCESSRVNIQVEPFSTFTFTRDPLYIASILFTRVHTYNFPDKRNYPFIGFESPSYELRFVPWQCFPWYFSEQVHWNPSSSWSSSTHVPPLWQGCVSHFGTLSVNGVNVAIKHSKMSWSRPWREGLNVH